MCSSRHLAILLLTICSSAGCGTMHNLFAPPEAVPGPYIGSGPGRCGPFGGVARSAALGMVGPLVGPGEVIRGELTLLRDGEIKDGFTQMRNGLWFTACGLGALVDTPVSLVGDIATFPIAYAHKNHHPWATWWGVQTDGRCPFWSLWTNPPNDEQKTEEQLENSR